MKNIIPFSPGFHRSHKDFTHFFKNIFKTERTYTAYLEVKENETTA